MALVIMATTLNDLRAKIVAELELRAWQETAFMDRLVKTKKEREAREHAASALQIAANAFKEAEIHPDPSRDPGSLRIVEAPEPDAEPCDECGAMIPDTATSGVNSSHFPECSLYEAEPSTGVEPRPFGAVPVAPNPSDLPGANLADLENDVEQENETQYTNYYVHCGVQWNDEWSCQCNDRCPECGGEIEPYASADADATDMHVHANFVPEGGFPEGVTNAAQLDGWDLDSFTEKDHAQDSDCTVDTETRLCVTCGVFHGRIPCSQCGGHAFHKSDCPETTPRG